MGREGSMKKVVIKALKPLDACSIENGVGVGTPGVNFADGWVELKCLEDWPKRATTMVRIEHFTPQQRIWLMKRWAAGGNVWLLLKVKRDWLLFDGQTAAEKVGRATREDLYAVARRTWKVFDGKDLIGCLQNTSPRTRL